MIVGVPREIKTAEHRVALVPAGAESLRGDGHTLFVEQGAGMGSGFPDDAYRAVGATIVPTAADVWARCEMVVKVKEPVERSEEHTSELQSRLHLVCRLLLEKKNTLAERARGATRGLVHPD